MPERGYVYMRIGIDVDGVLLNTEKFMLKYGSRFFRKEPVDQYGYTIEEIFGVSGIPVTLFGIRWFFPFYCRKYPPYSGAAKVYDELRRNGDSIYQITARKFAASKSPIGKMSFRFLKKWLRKNRFHYNKLIICDEKNVSAEKLGHCKNHNINVMIEDNPWTAALLAENGIRVLLYDAPYNRHVSAENITRVHNWNEIRCFLKKFRTEK